VELRPFRHITADSLEEAAAFLADPGARAVAGGTDLLGALRDNIHPDYPGLLVDLKRIPGLDEIREDRRGLHVGALATLADLATHPVVGERYPALAEAACWEADTNYPVPRRMTQDDCEAMLHAVLPEASEAKATAPKKRAARKKAAPAAAKATRRRSAKAP